MLYFQWTSGLSKPIMKPNDDDNINNNNNLEF